MLLRHATPRKNLSSIFKDGLLVSKSQGRIPAVWLHAASLSPWALMHVAQRHSCPAEDVVVLEVTVPRSWLKRHNRRGVRYCREDIAPERIRGVQVFGQLAAS